MKKIMSFAVMVILLIAAVSCVHSDKGTYKPDEEIKVEINIPESVTVDFKPFLTDKNGAYKLDENLFAIKDGGRCAFKDKTSYHMNEKVRVEKNILFADASALARMFDFEYILSDDKNSAEMKKGDLTVKITAKADAINVNGTDYPFITTIKIKDTLLLPVCDFAEALGYTFLYDSDTNISYIASESTLITKESKHLMEENYKKYDEIIYNYEDVKCDMTGVGKFKKTPHSERLVGIAYTTWHRSDFPVWGSGTWDLPLLGGKRGYKSMDRDVIYQHGVWLAEAGVDFVFVDWSNNTDYDPETMRNKRIDFRTIEEGTDLLFEIWATIPNAPKICIFVGPGHNGPGSVDNGNHQKKVDQVYNSYINNEANRKMYFFYDNKPLLICYGATPTMYGAEPSWNDDRFTVRWMTGYVGQQGNLFNAETLQSERYWSWEERGAQTYTVYKGTVEAVTCSASTRAQAEEGSPGYITAAARDDGATLKRQFQRANELGARIVLLVSWNEWTTGEQLSLEISKDLEPSQSFGTFYYDLMREQIRKFKGQI